MAPYPFALLGILFVLGLAVGHSASKEENWQVYTDHSYQVTLRFPHGWSNAAQNNQEAPYFRGPDGFFKLTASEGNTPQDLCEGSATHPLHPYGSHPQIRSMKIQGQKACLVWSSDDQPDRGSIGAELVVQYPPPIKIDGRYGQLVLIADKEHILEIAKTLRFLSPK